MATASGPCGNAVVGAQTERHIEDTHGIQIHGVRGHATRHHIESIVMGNSEDSKH